MGLFWVIVAVVAIIWISSASSQRKVRELAEAKLQQEEQERRNLLARKKQKEQEEQDRLQKIADDAERAVSRHRQRIDTANKRARNFSGEFGVVADPIIASELAVIALGLKPSWDHQDWETKESRKAKAEKVLSYRHEAADIEGLIGNIRLTSDDHFSRYVYYTDIESWTQADWEKDRNARINNLSGLQYAKKVESLELKKFGEFVDLAPLSGMDSLTHLKITFAEPNVDLSGLADSSVKELTLIFHDDARPDLSPLAGLDNLRSLNLTLSATAAGEVAPVLAAIPKLSELTLNINFNQSNEVFNVELLLGCLTIQRITIKGTGRGGYADSCRIRGLSTVSKLPRLQALSLDYVYSDKIFSELSDIVNLNELNLHYIYLSNERGYSLSSSDKQRLSAPLRELQHIRNLHKLSLINLRLTGDGDYPDIDMSPIGDIQALKELTIEDGSGGRVRHWGFLDKLKNLEVLNIYSDGCPVTKISESESLANLRELRLKNGFSGVKVDDVIGSWYRNSKLRNLKKLEVDFLGSSGWGGFHDQCDREPSTLPSLENLTIMCANARDFSEICTHFPGLRELSVNQISCYGTTDIAALNNLQNLKKRQH